jgi:uncharacterized metal-binding protein YceD (DUF177 family)
LQIIFSKIKGKPKNFTLEYSQDSKIKANYMISQKNSENNNDIVFCNQEIIGKIEAICNRCGKNIIVNIKEKSNFLISNGTYNGFDDKYDIIETNNGIINFNEILYGELELIKSDYFYCSVCEKIEKIEIEEN